VLDLSRGEHLPDASLEILFIVEVEAVLSKKRSNFFDSPFPDSGNGRIRRV
jgi:hypothetical protein